MRTEVVGADGHPPNVGRPAVRLRRKRVCELCLDSQERTASVPKLVVNERIEGGIVAKIVALWRRRMLEEDGTHTFDFGEQCAKKARRALGSVDKGPEEVE